MIGIDLGTSNSCVAEFTDKQSQMLKNALGDIITPTFLAFQNGKVTHGVLAKNQHLLSPKSTIYSTKRLIGRRFDEPEVQQ